MNFTIHQILKFTFICVQNKYIFCVAVTFVKQLTSDRIKIKFSMFPS